MDDEGFSGRQITLHEVTHERIAKGEINLEDVRSFIEARFEVKHTILTN